MAHASTAPTDLLAFADAQRREASAANSRDRKSDLGQFLTPAPIARLMASMLTLPGKDISILDPGAGVGSLFAAVVQRLTTRKRLPRKITVTAFELDPAMQPALRKTGEACAGRCRALGIEFEGHYIEEDFLAVVAAQQTGDLFRTSHPRRFTCAILNPPYRKIATDSAERELIRQIGTEASNLYAGFVAAAMHCLQPQGELVAITPRSFCNGPYFEPFRKSLLGGLSLRRLHTFESRDTAFAEDAVLQENIISYGTVGVPTGQRIAISTSDSPPDEVRTLRRVPIGEVVHPEDPHSFVHVPANDADREITAWSQQLGATLKDLELAVSTGRVVDFRSADHLRAESGTNTVPLIYPTHFRHGGVAWPQAGRKPNAIAVHRDTKSLLVPSRPYVLVKRFSSKEERRRLVAALFDPATCPTDQVGFENHVSYFHGDSLTLQVARGLTAYLNSTLADQHFRLFSGHTQVNATDLRKLRYPTVQQLTAIADGVGEGLGEQRSVDAQIELILMAPRSKQARGLLRVRRRVEEAQTLLAAVGVARAQRNERSALTLLALLHLSPDAPWSDASEAVIGITPIMDFIAETYGKRYAPNTRETIRRQTMHQFCQVGIAFLNPDKPRAVNSPHTIYQIAADVLELARHWESPDQQAYLDAFRSSRKHHPVQLAPDESIPVRLSSGKLVRLSPGGQNPLLASVVAQFLPTHAPKAEVLYLGDAAAKWAFADLPSLAALGAQINPHGKMPDLLVHDAATDRLLVVECVTSHGPVDGKRKTELEVLFHSVSPRLVFLTAFQNRAAMKRFLTDIAWGTGVWLAEEPSHLIQFGPSADG